LVSGLVSGCRIVAPPGAAGFVAVAVTGTGARFSTRAGFAVLFFDSLDSGFDAGFFTGLAALAGGFAFFGAVDGLALGLGGALDFGLDGALGFDLDGALGFDLGVVLDFDLGGVLGFGLGGVLFFLTGFFLAGCFFTDAFAGFPFFREALVFARVFPAEGFVFGRTFFPAVFFDGAFFAAFFLFFAAFLGGAFFLGLAMIFDGVGCFCWKF